MIIWRRPLLLGLWFCALYWPFAHAGGYSHPAILGVLGLFLGVGELWPHWVWRWLHRIAVLYGELCLAWNRWATIHWLDLVVKSSLHGLLTLPINQWNQINAHIAAPILILAGFVGWFFFSRCQTYNQAVGWYALGTFIIAISHILWTLPAELPLAAYLTLGLAVLADFHQVFIGRNAHRTARSWRDYPLWGLILALPLSLGWQMPEHPPSNPLHILRQGALASRQVPARTGYGPGITQIGHSLIRSQALEFVAHTTQPYYWQAATYTHFNGHRWSNPGSGLSYLATPTDVALPLVPPYYQSHVPTYTLTARITDLAAQNFTTLFYAGVPTQFSVPVIVYTRSNHFAARGVRQYVLRAKVPVYRLSALESARFAAPPSVLADDLQLPHNLSPRVRALARRLTQSATGPWAAAQHVKQYLDSHYQYSLTVPPAQGNVVNQFLFVSKKGYCDQFSTAFIMMMRTLNIPARWAVGYDAGTFQPAHHDYVVRALDAHSWAQIWIAHLGWIPIDPTPGFSSPIVVASAQPSQRSTVRPRLVPAVPDTPGVSLQALAHLRRSRAATLVNPRRQPPDHLPATKSSETSRLWGIVLTAGLLLCGSAALIWQRRRYSVPELIWRRMQRALHRRLKRAGHNKTPRQWGREWVRCFPDDEPIIWALVQLLESAFYSQKELSDKDRERLVTLWRQLRHSPHRRRLWL